MKLRIEKIEVPTFRRTVGELDAREFQLVYKTVNGKKVSGRYFPATAVNLRKEIDKARLRIHKLNVIQSDGKIKTVWASELRRLASLNQWPLAGAIR